MDVLIGGRRVPLEALNDDLLDIHGRRGCCRWGSSDSISKSVSRSRYNREVSLVIGLRRGCGGVDRERLHGMDLVTSSRVNLAQV